MSTLEQSSMRQRRIRNALAVVTAAWLLIHVAVGLRGADAGWPITASPMFSGVVHEDRRLEVRVVTSDGTRRVVTPGTLGLTELQLARWINRNLVDDESGAALAAAWTGRTGQGVRSLIVVEAITAPDAPEVTTEREVYRWQR